MAMDSQFLPERFRPDPQIARNAFNFFHLCLTVEIVEFDENNKRGYKLHVENYPLWNVKLKPKILNLIGLHS